MPFSETLAQSECILPRIWTEVTDSISYEDNRLGKGASSLTYKFISNILLLWYFTFFIE